MPRPEVVEAMAMASTSFVGLVELNEKIGEYIAQISGSEGGMIVRELQVVLCFLWQHA